MAVLMSGGGGGGGGRGVPRRRRGVGRWAVRRGIAKRQRVAGSGMMVVEAWTLKSFLAMKARLASWLRVRSWLSMATSTRVARELAGSWPVMLREVPRDQGWTTPGLATR